jgi:hypothetical protein
MLEDADILSSIESSPEGVVTANALTQRLSLRLGDAKSQSSGPDAVPYQNGR